MDMPPPFCASHPLRNQLLAAMPAAVYQRLLPCLEQVPLPLGKELQDPRQTLRYVYFPVDGLVSLVHVTKTGGEVQIAAVGSEGVTGISVLMGGERSSIRATVQGEGSAYRLLASLLKEEIHRDSELRFLLLRYCHALLIQVAQMALCNRYHSIEQRLCRCLLLASQHQPEQGLLLTQEQIARQLGVRREGVTLAAGKLQQQGAIHYHRGLIQIVNREKLEQLACECYQELKSKIRQ